MRPTIDIGALRNTRFSDYAIRFVFGGVVTACTGIVARRYGPEIGGLFLAFPAVLPASLTLVRQRHGSGATTDDARGGIVGSFGLVAFAAVAAMLIERYPASALPAATIAWAGVALAVWFSCYGWRSGGRVTRRARSRPRRGARPRTRS